jgi:hypothetical protein
MAHSSLRRDPRLLQRQQRDLGLFVSGPATKFTTKQQPVGHRGQQGGVRNGTYRRSVRQHRIELLTQLVEQFSRFVTLPD